MIQEMNDSVAENIVGKARMAMFDQDCEPVDPLVPVPRALLGRTGFMLFHLGAALDAIADSRLVEVGVDARGYCILAILSVDGPGSQHELAKLLGAAPGALVADIDQLEGKGFVERNRDPEDRRRSRVTLLPAGENALAEADKVSADIVASMLSGLSPAEIEQLTALLNRGLLPSSG
jgi:MarR family transcriptional regulator, lower aerobic nicotinate degradation pathway regulator